MVALFAVFKAEISHHSIKVAELGLDVWLSDMYYICRIGVIRCDFM